MKNINAIKFLVFMFIFGLMLVLPVKARAFDFNAQLRDKAPQFVIDDINNRCTNDHWHIVAWQWLSPKGNPTAISLSVDSGTSQVNLDFNFINYRCQPQSNPYSVSETFQVTKADNTDLPGYIGSSSYPSNSANSYNSGVLRNVAYSVSGGFRTGFYSIDTYGNGYFTNSDGSKHCAAQNNGDYTGVPYPGQFGGCVVGKTTLIIFVNVVAKGAILVSKYEPSTHAPNLSFGDVDSSVRNANVVIFDAKGNTYSSKNDYWSLPNLLVNNGPFHAQVEVPQGWNLKYAKSGTDNIGLNSCDNTGSPRYCITNKFNLKEAFSLADFTYLDLYYDAIAQGSLGCTSANGDYYWTGWGIDMSNQPATPHIKVFDGNNVLQDIYGNVAGTNTARITKDDTTYPNASNSTKYDINEPLGSNFHDNTNRQLTVKLDTTSGDITLGTVAVGPGTSCATNPYFYPWLQTERGNVVANGQINGQQDSPNLLGSIRYNGATNKEAEFLVISAVSGGGPFCSVYNYILTNEDALKSNCSNGTGYTVLNNPSLNIGGKDAVVQATLKAYSDMKSNNNGCAQDKTRQDMSMKSIDTSDCSSGAVYKLTGGNSLDTINVTRGRVTIYVDGDLYINGDITTDNSPVPLSQLPSLAIVANGKINIAPGVATIDAVLYGADKIDTCSDPNSVKCNLQLQINGMLVGKNGFSFDRTFFSKSSPGPAERVRFSPHSTVQVPPGIDSLYYRSVSSVPYKLDTSEYSPRF